MRTAPIGVTRTLSARGRESCDASAAVSEHASEMRERGRTVPDEGEVLPVDEENEEAQYLGERGCAREGGEDGIELRVGVHGDQHRNHRAKHGGRDEEAKRVKGETHLCVIWREHTGARWATHLALWRCPNDGPNDSD